MRSACGNRTGTGSREIVPLSNGIRLTVNSLAKQISIRYRCKNTDIDPMINWKKQGAWKNFGNGEDCENINNYIAGGMVIISVTSVTAVMVTKATGFCNIPLYCIRLSRKSNTGCPAKIGVFQKNGPYIRWKEESEPNPPIPAQRQFGCAKLTQYSSSGKWYRYLIPAPTLKNYVHLFYKKWILLAHFGHERHSEWRQQRCFWRHSILP